MRIAIADDEKILLDHLRNTVQGLVPEGEVVPFSDTAELLEAAGRKSFDVAFLDIQMPGMTGLTLAQKLKELNDKTNIIFVTGFDGYQGQAIDIFASGYVRKPVTKEKIENQMKNLRYPVEKKKRVYAQTFGNFTLFVDGAPVKFTREKSQMLLAYLIHRNGSVVNRKELSLALFDDGIYDDNRKSYVSKICSDVIKNLEVYGVAELINKTTTALSVNCEMMDCDLYEFLKGDEDAIKKFNGEYMSQYSFGEEMILYLEKNR